MKKKLLLSFMVMAACTFTFYPSQNTFAKETIMDNTQVTAQAQEHVVARTKDNAVREVSPLNNPAPIKLTDTWDKTFPKSDKVDHKKVRFVNRYGITLAGDLYKPKNIGNKKLAALAVSGPFGAVKEQSSGLYAQTMAEQGFVTLAFDPSYTGESGGEPRNTASPDINTEDFSAAVDFLGQDSNVDRNRIGLIGICGFGGMALADTVIDHRVKAVATFSLYDMTETIGHGLNHAYTEANRQKIFDNLAQKRWAAVDRGTTAPEYHELPFTKDGEIIHLQDGNMLPETLPANADPVVKDFFNYYRTQRGYHPRSLNSAYAWNDTIPYSFMNFDLLNHIDEIAPRPVLLVAGSKAHSLYMSENAYKHLKGDNNQLLIIPGASHVDLYDQTSKIPFRAVTDFFNTYLK